MKINAFNILDIELMSRLSDNSIDIVIADIPYGIDVGNMSYLKENKVKVKQKNGSNRSVSKKEYIQKDWDKEVPPQAYFDEVCRIGKHQIIFGVEYVNWTGLGKGRIKWNKGVPEGVSFKGYEMMYCSFIDYTHEIDYLWAGMMQGKSMSEPMTQQGNKKLNEKRLHPTHKPIILYDIIFTFCIEKGICIEKVLDTHLGLASIIISALKIPYLIKEFTASESDKDYFNDAMKRINDHQKQLELF